MSTESVIERMQKNSYLSGANAAYVEELYEAFLVDPNAVDQKWRDYFLSLQRDYPGPQDQSHSKVKAEFLQLAKQSAKAIQVGSAGADVVQAKVDNLIGGFRRWGHLSAAIDPLQHEKTALINELQLSFYGLDDQSLTETCLTHGVMDKTQASVAEIYKALQQVYCGTVGAEFSYIIDEDERQWFQHNLEKTINTPLQKDERRDALKWLTYSEGLEKYLDVKYVGQKRFSIEGLESLIPLMHAMTDKASQSGIKEIAVGMAHRGRLNVLFNYMGKSSAELFKEFEGTKDYGLVTGDVKYHMGFSADVKTSTGDVHLSLAFNPSHLEFISPVVMGSVRARQYHQGNKSQDYALCVAIHGDSSFAGQGIVMETMNMSGLPAYNVGGTLHIVTNNQIGFTTSHEHARTSTYSSDVAKIINAPVLHVNADDPDAVVKVAKLAIEYRMTFHKDVVIDLIGYRRHGHQEVDEPTSTQPLMYQKIAQQKTARTLYAAQLVSEGVCQADEPQAWLDHCRDLLDAGGSTVELLPDGLSAEYEKHWQSFIGQTWESPANTSVSMNELEILSQSLTTYPDKFTLQRQINTLMKARKEMAKGDRPLDWGFAETLAYASLLHEGHSLRMSGQDARRGTFSHRQSLLCDMESGESYMPLAHLPEPCGDIQLYDSLLSESAVLGYEYGYAMTAPADLVIWEAQFGDFANGAQVIIDQFISSAWQKWNRLCGVVLFLPHGQEGMGPEHSSARLERYLQLCAQKNIQVCMPTTPAQIFHLLRRQVLRPFKKPLIIMTPKKLLRHKKAVSSLGELADGQFELVIPDHTDVSPDKITRVVLCSGKVYYDLLEKRDAKDLSHVAIIRIEQLYPFPYNALADLLAQYPHCNDVVLCQEEPKNQGLWFCTRDRIQQCLLAGQQLYFAGRPALAAPAVGYPSLHATQQESLVDDALGLSTSNAID